MALRKNAPPPHALRAAIVGGDETANMLAQRFGSTAKPVYKWRKRAFGDVHSRKAHQFQIVSSPIQETVAVHLGRTELQFQPAQGNKESMQLVKKLGWPCPYCGVRAAW